MNKNKNDFLYNYMQYCDGNEVPKMFHKWAGISALSSLVSRRVWLDQGAFTVHCNLYVVLVGKPADKKSTAMNIARKLVSLLGVNVAPSSVTRERIYELMDSKNDQSGCNSEFEYNDEVFKVSQLALFCNEMVTLLSSGGNALGMIEFLTDIWDKDFHDIDTKNKGKNTIYGPNITILACMTPDQTAGLLKQEIITGGFSRRCIFVTPDSVAPPIAIPRLTEYQREAWDNCVRIGKELMQVKGEFDFDDDGEAAYVKWYNKNHEEKLKVFNPIEVYYLNTLPRYVLQLAMLLSLSRDRNNFTLNAALIKEAVHILKPVQKDLADIFTGSGRNQLASVKSRIMSHLTQAKGWVTRKKLSAILFDHASPQELTDTLQHMRDTDLIVESMAGGLVRYCLKTVADSGTCPEAPHTHQSNPLLDLDLSLGQPQPSDQQGTSVDKSSDVDGH